MKHLLIMLFSVILISGTNFPVNGQDTIRPARKELDAVTLKDIKKQARDYEKKGYYVAVGAPSIEWQLTKSREREMETDELGFPKYIIGFGRSVAETQIAAKLQATEVAKLYIAGTIATSVAAIIENNIANAQVNAEEANSVTKTIGTAKSIIVQEIGRIIPLVELYKDIGKNIEADITIAYNSEMAQEMAKKVIRKQLEEETKIQQEKLDILLKK